MSLVASRGRSGRPPLPRGPPPSSTTAAMLSAFSSTLSMNRLTAVELTPLIPSKKRSKNEKSDNHSDQHHQQPGKEATKFPSLPSKQGPWSSIPALLPLNNMMQSRPLPKTSGAPPVSPGVGRIENPKKVVSNGLANGAIKRPDNLNLGVSLRNGSGVMPKPRGMEISEERLLRSRNRLKLMRRNKKGFENPNLCMFLRTLQNSLVVCKNTANLEPLSPRKGRRRKTSSDDEDERKRERKRRKIEESSERVREKRREKERDRQREKDGDVEKERRRKDRESTSHGGASKARRREKRRSDHDKKCSSNETLREREIRKEKERKEGRRGYEARHCEIFEKCEHNVNELKVRSRKNSEGNLDRDSLLSDDESKQRKRHNEREKDRRHRREKQRGMESNGRHSSEDSQETRKRKCESYEDLHDKSRPKKDHEQGMPSLVGEKVKDLKGCPSTSRGPSPGGRDKSVSTGDSQRSSPESGERSAGKPRISFKSSPASFSPARSSSVSSKSKKGVELKSVAKRERTSQELKINDHPAPKKKSAFAPVDEEEMKLREAARIRLTSKPDPNGMSSWSPKDSSDGSPSRRRERPQLSSVPAPRRRKDATSPLDENVGTPALSPPGGNGKPLEQKPPAHPQSTERAMPLSNTEDAAEVVAACAAFVKGKEDVWKLMEKGEYTRAEQLGLRVFEKGFAWALAKETQYRQRQAGNRSNVRQLRKDKQDCIGVYHYVASGFAKKLANELEALGRRGAVSVYRRNMSKAYGRMFILQRFWDNEKRDRLKELTKKARSGNGTSEMSSGDWRMIGDFLGDHLSAIKYYEMSVSGSEEAGNECRMM